MTNPIKVDKEGTLVSVTNLRALKKGEINHLTKGKIFVVKFIYEDKSEYIQHYPSEASMHQWYSIISKAILGGK